MKILLFIDSLGPGGAQRQLVGLASLLKHEGYNVKVNTYHNDPFYDYFLKKNGVDFENIKGANNKIRRIFLIRNAIKKFAPDIVISYLDTPSIIACIIRLTGVKFKLIVSERNTTQKINLIEKLKFLFYKRADKIVTNSYSQQKFIQNYFNELFAKTITITNYVDTAYFTPKELIGKTNIPRILVVASIWPSKNTLLFIDALKILDQKGFNYKLKWFGKDNSNIEYFNDCQLKIKKLNLSNKVFLLDKTSDILSEYLKADFFCLPSLYEGTPNVICEAISCGLPIICSDVCDNSKYVMEGVNGFLFDPNNPQSIADKMESALKIDNNTYKFYSQQSRIIAEEKLSEGQFLSKYLKLINSDN